MNAHQVSVSIHFNLVQVICRGFFTSFGRRNTVFFGKTYRLAQSSFRSFRHFITDIACHLKLNNYVIYLSVRHWTLVDSNVHHNTTKVRYDNHNKCVWYFLRDIEVQSCPFGDHSNMAAVGNNKSIMWSPQNSLVIFTFKVVEAGTYWLHSKPISEASKYDLLLYKHRASSGENGRQLASKLAHHKQRVTRSSPIFQISGPSSSMVRAPSWVCGFDFPFGAQRFSKFAKRLSS